MNQAQIKLKILFEEVASLGDMSGQQKQELFTKLEGAIVLNIVSRLFDQLSESDKIALREEKFKTDVDLFGYFASVVPQDDFHSAAVLSVEEVTKKFLGKI